LSNFVVLRDAGGKFAPLVVDDHGVRPGKKPVFKIMGYSG